MNFPDPHEPTPEFRALLEREIANALRRDSYFRDPVARRGLTIGSIAGLAAGVLITLAVGLMIGASSGYASAEEILKARGDSPLPPTATLAVLKNIPPLMFACNADVRATAAPLPPVKQGIPVIDLPSTNVKTSVTFGGILGLREVSNGSIIVDDGARKQVSVVDSTLSQVNVVRDSIPGSPTSYGVRPVPLIRYLGDSSLLADGQAGSLLVLGPNAQVARAMAPSHADMLFGLAVVGGATDDKGRIVFGIHERLFGRGLANAYTRPESVFVVRSDPETRRSDTLAKVKSFPGTMMINNGTGVTRFTVDPLPLIDEWSVASDGSIAILRGQDYHIDWIHTDGTMHSTTKLPFDWKRITDEEKQRLIDSVREVETPKMALNLGRRRVGPPPDGGDGGGRGTGRGYAAPGSIEQGPPVPVEYVPPALKDMFDYYPPVRVHSMLPDMDGNIWILPTSSAQSKNGELVYDVVNVKGDFRRVRVPLGRSIAGFGKGGVVFLVAGDLKSGFYLEKTKLPAGATTRSATYDPKTQNGPVVDNASLGKLLDSTTKLVKAARASDSLAKRRP